MPEPLDIEGQRFERLVAHTATRLGRNRAWVCSCDCGGEITVITGSLIAGMTKSCGCLVREKCRLSNLHHGHTSAGRRSPTYRSWQNMVARCTNPKATGYHRYGGRGIKVCKRWRQYENFLADMGERPTGRTIDRENNDGNYEPGNCKWSTRKEQASNRRPPTRA